MTHFEILHNAQKEVCVGGDGGVGRVWVVQKGDGCQGFRNQPSAQKAWNSDRVRHEAHRLLELRDSTFARSCVAWTLLNYQDNKFSCLIFTRMQWGNWAIDKFSQILHIPLVWKISQKRDVNKAMCKIRLYFRSTAPEWNWKNIMKVEIIFYFQKGKDCFRWKTESHLWMKFRSRWRSPNLK